MALSPCSMVRPGAFRSNRAAVFSALHPVGVEERENEVGGLHGICTRLQLFPGFVKRRNFIIRENAALGVFVTLHSPSEAMKKEAVAAGVYHSPGWNQDYPRLQILTVSDLLAGERVQMPPTGVTFKQAQKVEPKPEAEQGKLNLTGL